jgi:hypothetical protein
MPPSPSELRALSHASDEELMQRFQADNSEEPIRSWCAATSLQS